MIGTQYPSTSLFPGATTYPDPGVPDPGTPGSVFPPIAVPSYIPERVSTYTCVVYKTTTGQIVAELPLADQPQWSRQLNQSSTITIRIRAGSDGLPTLSKLYELVVPKFFSLAILWGDYVCQAGPILPYDIDDTSNTLLQLGAGDFWTLLNGRVLHNPNWNPAAKRITDTSADTTITDTLGNIARTLVRNSVNWQYRVGSALPVDVPANTTPAGTATMTYYGYDLAPVGQRLTELTQLDGGPDIDFRPYLYTDSTGRYIRHQMRVGRDSDGFLVQPGTPPTFDYGSSLRAIKVSGDGSKTATTTWVKGSGDKTAMLYGTATTPNLTSQGWPVSDYVDSGHISSTNQTQLNAWAAADLVLYGKATEQWTAYVDSNTSPQLGAYDPGTFGTYNITHHPWLPESQYSGRILGLSNGRGPGEVVHMVEGRGPY